MPEKKKSKLVSINLSSKGKDNINAVFYRWAVDAGRAIIVGIELIALAALGYRFIIDRQIVDLNDEIETQELFVARQQTEESLYRGVQERLKNIKGAEEETNAKITILNDILGSISRGSFFSTNLTISQETVTLEGSTISVTILNNFIETLKTYPFVDSISVAEITTSDEGINFKMSIGIKESQLIQES